MLMSNITHTRIEYIDFLRVIATIAVVCTHVSSIYINGPDFDSMTWHVHNITGALFRWCVPIFVMISGALFLDKNKIISITYIYNKNIVRIITALAVWSIIYSFFQYSTIERYNNFYSIIGFSLIGHYHLWFLYMILSIYFALPILKYISQSPTIIHYFLVLSFIFTFIIPIIIYIIRFILPQTAYDLFNTHPYFIEGINYNYNQLTPHTVTGYTFYFCFGHYLNTRTIKTSTLKVLIIGLLGFAVTAIPTTLLSRDHFCGDFYHYLSIGPLLEAYAIFIIGKRYWSNINIKQVSELAKTSFGVYLIHPMIIETLLLFNIDTTMVNPIIGIPVFIIFVLMLSTSIVFILLRIPWFNRYCL